MEGKTFLFLLLSGLCFLPVCFPRRYILVEEAKTWTEAQRYCREKYTDLASDSNQQDSDQLLAAAQKHDVWIGLYDDINSWRWSLEEEGYYGEGEAEFRNLNALLFNNHNGVQACVLMEADGRWNDIPCFNSYQFVCYDGTDSSSSFILVAETKAWEEAQSYCREHYTDLASVRNQAENDHIKGIMKSKFAWIGLHRDSWGWSDGSPYSLKKWDTQRPGGGFNTPCVLLHAGLWRDSSCDLERYFVCQHDPVKKHVLRVQVTRKDSTVNLEEAAEAMLWQFRETLKEHGLREDVKLTWRKQPDGKIFHLEKTEKKKVEETENY